MGAVCREVITLQLGPYANCVGAHWWNLQERQRCLRSGSEISGDVQFRFGVTEVGGETYTPRLIILDDKDGVRSVRGTMHEEPAPSTPAWTGKVTTHREDPTEISRGAPTQEGGPPEDGGGRETGLAGGGAMAGTSEESYQPITREGVWSDFLQTRLHPKSLCVLSDGDPGGPESLEEMEERLHFFSEECDYLQGFHILCDTHSGFSAAGSKMAELLHDEFPGRGILSLGTRPVQSELRATPSSVYQLMNHVMCLVSLVEHSSAHCALSLGDGAPAPFPHLIYDAGWGYHSSAVLAMALESMTAPYRLPSPTYSMSQLTDTLTYSGRKVLAASCSLPFPIGSSSFLPDALLSHMTSPLWCSVSGGTDGGPAFSQSVVLRGIPPPRQIRCPPAGVRPPSPLHTCTSGEEVLRCYLSSVCPRTLSVSHLLGAPCTPGPTFPQFFSPHITADGGTMEEPLTPPAVVGGVPVMAALRTPHSLRQTLRGLADEVTKMAVRRRVNFSTAGMEEDDLREAVSDLHHLAQCYGGEEDEDSEDTD